MRKKLTYGLTLIATSLILASCDKGNETIKNNFEANCKNERQQHIRIPLINGINTDNPEEFAKYFDEIIFAVLATPNKNIDNFLVFDRWFKKYN